MAETTRIEWCDATWNPWIGCTKISPACDHCYAEELMATRFQQVQWGSGQQRARTSTENWKEPLRWNAKACRFVQCNECGWRGESRGAVCGHCHSADTKPARRRVFCASLADVFDNEVPAAWRQDLFDLIRRCENLDFLLLTKRVGNVTRMLQEVASMLRSEHGAQIEREPGLQAGPVGRTGDRRGGPNLARGEADFRSLDRRDDAERGVARLSRRDLEARADLLAWIERWLAGNPPRNVWLGATICNQDEADRDIPKLLSTPAAVRFLSVEPMLGEIELTGHEYSVAPGLDEGIDWLTGKTSQASNIFGGDAAPWRSRDCYDFPQDAEEPRIHWVISGGESGPHARPMHPHWARDLRDQCAAAGVPFFMKQMTKRAEIPADLMTREFPQ